MVWENVNISIDWRLFCVHAIWTRLATLANLPWSAGPGFAASLIAFISHERKQVVIQFLNKDIHGIHTMTYICI